MTNEEAALVRRRVEELYRGKRRSWQGFGGTGNPFETWEDLLGMTGLSFILDTDSVFTLTGWGASRLISKVDEIQEQCDEIIGATEQLRNDKTIQDLDSLGRSYDMLSRQVTDIRRSNRANIGTVRRAIIQRELSSFIQDNLAPSVTTAQQDGSSRSPAEARTFIKKSVDSLLEKIDQMDVLVDALTDAVPDMETTIPAKVAMSWVQRIMQRVGKIQERMLLQNPSDRVASAMTDLVQLSTDLATLDLLDKESAPILERGAFTCAAAGGGAGAIIRGNVSAPYSLITGVADTLRLSIDGGGTITLPLPSSPATITIQFPRSAATVPFPPPLTTHYVVPAAPPIQNVFFFVDGVIGAAALFVAGAPLTAAQVVAILLPAVPLDTFGNPYLLIDTVVTDLPAGNYATVRIRYNDGTGGFPPAVPTADIGSHIWIIGNIPLLTVFGLPSEIDVFAPFGAYIMEWPALSQTVVLEELKELLLGYGVTIQGETNLISSGVARIEAAPTTIYFSHYHGSAIWEASTKRLTLTGDVRDKIIIGDSAYIGGAALGIVESIENDGVSIDIGSGPLVPSTTGISAIVPDISIVAGMTVELSFLKRTSRHRVSGPAVVDVDGRWAIPVSRVPYLYLMIPLSADARIFLDIIDMRSTDSSPTGSLELKVGAQDASGALGMALGLSISLVDQLSILVGDFIASGVSSGDIVRPATGPDWVVDDVISDKKISVLGTVLGTFSGAVTIYNHKYLEYNELLATQLGAWNSIPSDADFLRETYEVIRAPGMLGAGNRLKTLLLQLQSVSASLKTVATTYRATCGEPSSYMVDLREAFEEAGADRAVEYLQCARVKELLSFTVDDASSSRQLLSNIRVFGRKTLGTSIYLAARELEQSVLLRPEMGINADSTPLSTEVTGPPRSTRR